ncbi:MAG: pilus assembly protein [Nitrospiria bacterium]
MKIKKMKKILGVAGAILTASLAWSMTIQPALAASLNLAQTPIFLVSKIKPNVLIIYDNSESMDGYMSGTLVAGNDPNTRSNIGRRVLVNTINNYLNAFNFGLMTYKLSGGTPTKYNTYAYFLGSNTGMVFTSTCNPVGNPVSGLTPGIDPTNGNRRCVPNPQPFSGGTYVTFDQSGDDPTINDVLYDSGTYTSLWGLTAGTGNPCGIGFQNGTAYNLYLSHKTTNSWTSSAFSGSAGLGCFTPTDAGYLSTNPPITRQLYLPRAWGYLSNVTGAGTIIEPVLAYSNTHILNLTTALAPETGTTTPEIKNGAIFTPLAGTLNTAATYISTGVQGYASPVQYSCQYNFVILVTDGLPTARADGTLYTTAERTNTYNSGSGTWTFGTAAQDAINAAAALYATSNSMSTPPFNKTPVYVVALGDTVNNAGAIAVMNAMASAGGTGVAYLADNSTLFSSAIQQIASSIVSKVAASSSVALDSASINNGSHVYQAQFHSGDWSGTLYSYPINPDGTLGPSNWDAGALLDTMTSGTGWNTGRTIITYKPSSNTGIPFRWPVNPAAPTATELDIAQVGFLNTNPASGTNDSQGSARLNYLRGSTADEGAGNLYRKRPTSRLGDLIDSAPYYAGPPSFGYPGSYTTFATAYSARNPMIYVGGNDGILHGFDAATGNEKLAYVPGKVYSLLNQLTSTAYSHHYYVDGSPTVGDVYYGGAWHTVLVGGLGGGGQGFYALEVTDPSTFSEGNASSHVLWEFTDDKDTDTDSTMQYALGYSYSQPSIVQMANGKWAAVFGNGYNNTDPDGYASTSGYAVLYIVDIQTGAVIKKISTQTGSATTPNGLATPTAVDLNGDGIIDAIYAGDLLGNMWKFDVSSNNPANWKVAYGTFSPQPLFTATYGTMNTPQPITTKPEVGLGSNGGYMVYFGTGKYLENTDNATTDTQTFYGIWDNGAAVNGRSVLQVQTATDVTIGLQTFRSTSSNNVNYGPQKGWYMDLPDSGERAITFPVLRSGKIIFTTLIPDTAPCDFGGSGFLMELDLDGRHLTYAVFSPSGGTTTDISGMKVVGIPSAPGIENGQNGQEFNYLNTSSGTINVAGTLQGNNPSGRVYWKQLR